ncbi:OmpA family protein [Frigoriflavimonas asaccharolytica]|uniref:Outer membrane protein OmpA-like peptidoglycan-associated protein n=1 Tax=Frigoriflavimonas asaccharolytica TaxID=2735899 RepID=A0A8J8G8K3_9FLAO|nr:OmpA family protein [Frigoriflavimonas asaccharolytica]NRS91932.1 outer membrane protein OmpA-like peptidoglycan-associated protein [Frigoriflavimonas asaccharolytica]
MKKYILLGATVLFLVSCKKPPAGGNLGVLQMEAAPDHWTNIQREGGASHSEGAENHAEGGTHAAEMVDVEVNGAKLKGNKGGLEESMAMFLSKDGYKNATDDAALKETWYSFDQVNFKMGSSNQLLEGSEGQLKNLAQILKAYPDAKIKIGGYTDKTGDEAVNTKISQQRADFVKSELSKMGVGAQVLGAEGYGSKFAKVAATATDAERAVDRKMAVRFAK